MSAETCFSCRHWIMPSCPPRIHPVVGACGLSVCGIDWRPSNSTCERHSPLKGGGPGTPPRLKRNPRLPLKLDTKLQCGRCNRLTTWLEASTRTLWAGYCAHCEGQGQLYKVELTLEKL